MKTRSARIAIIGKPNVGKSTFINAILEQPISIATHKAQTTRHCILGIKTVKDTQLVFVDTPGVHVQKSSALHASMNKVAGHSIYTAQIVLWITDKGVWDKNDKRVAEMLADLSCPVIWCVNKVDLLSQSSELSAHIETIVAEFSWIKYVMLISARTKYNLTELENLLISMCPSAPFSFPTNVVSNRSEAFIASETIRANLFKNVHQEVPYATYVTIDSLVIQAERTDISATLWVEKNSQKAIVIGKKGSNIKRIGIGARLDLCRIMGAKVNLKLWVKVQANWSNNADIIAGQDLLGG